ncbi:MAG: hypothetical protein JSV59_06505 [Flavobacteriaceae bacterium]|nr:MAG: hypothetical protein JSV59_06505 [Flavobacteriaceae bacterium]
MKLLLTLSAILVLIITNHISAQSEVLFNGVELQDSFQSTKAKMEPFAEQLEIFEIENPTFPLSNNLETHMVLSNYKSGNGTISELVFTFADDKLVYIQAYGNAVESITAKRKDTAQTYMNYNFYPNDGIVTKPSEDKVWILSKDAMHPNLFTWDNPYLPSNKELKKTHNPSARIPDFIEMGGNLDQLKPNLERESVFTTSKELDGSDPNAQLQIDCFGVEYAGFPRKFEARFGDGKLNVLWILTGKGEEDRIRQKLINEYGAVIFKDDNWEVFNNWQVMLRKDKPEVLVLTEELAAFYKKDYFKQ